MTRDELVLQKLPSALAALHNFIGNMTHPDEICMYDGQEFDFNMGLHPESAGELEVAVTPDEAARASGIGLQLTCAGFPRESCSRS